MIRFLDGLLTFVLALTFMFSLVIVCSIAVQQITLQYKDVIKIKNEFRIMDKL